MKLRRYKSKSPPSSMNSVMGSSPREHGISLSTSSSISQEYKAALRTDSYAELWWRVQSELSTRLPTASLLSSSSSRDLFIAHLSETLLEPDRLTLAAMIKSLHVHRLLVDYFKASSDAWDVCELLLIKIQHTRANYGRIRRVIRLAKKRDDAVNCYEMISGELGAFSLLANPLSDVSPEKFHDMNEGQVILLKGLIRKCKRVRMKARLSRIRERAGMCCLAISCGLMGIASVMLAVHGGAIMVVVGPGVMSSCFGLGLFAEKEEKLLDSDCPSHNKRSSSDNNKTRSQRKRSLSLQFDAAAKGLYVLINDMGTMCSLLGRLQDEVDHTREWADMGAKSLKSDTMILTEVMRELDMNSLCFMEHLEELEEHIYLCLLAIDKSRRCVLQEISVASSRREDGS
ncbi:hypothetical protein SAY86_006710 [Trapa natans]|uniref:Uncharacterized protein n=1 Tax=Trapa natans TaxID=22666 RepID=A0AAN7LEP9_TRANT|nr:hypothetical protein SAY86_006710 [Trapa natans]